ncbi:hypothetical protein F4781DRAFT_137921 [Annulohypoxylon bovei var. microspora]|nr:hypothetical protein F4781DRAFT_137921 [Annulohypoxylon bovei var. microspora]
MAFEQTRDLRGSAQDSKRFKDHTTKWTLRGYENYYRSLPGSNTDVVEGGLLAGEGDYAGSNSQKFRPWGPRDSHRYRTNQNIYKSRESRFEHRTSAWRAKIDAQAELNDPSNISRSLHELMPSSPRRNHSISDNILYSFDRSESPYKPLALDVFVKANPKETEKFVEKEYEILDNNGDALKGRKARQNLRHKNRAAAVDEPDFLEDDGFALV